MLIKIDDLYVNPKSVQYVRFVDRAQSNTSDYIEIGFRGNSIRLRTPGPVKFEEVVSTINSVLENQP